MTHNRMIELLKTELLCVKKNVYNACDRDCEHCDLVQDAEEIIKMYSRVIDLVKKHIPLEPRVGRKEIHCASYDEYENLVYCPKCGFQLLTKVNYCPKCGQAVKCE